MSGAQIRALLWLRWRLTWNAWRKSGGLGAVLSALIGIGGAVIAVVAFGGGLVGGYLGLHDGSPSAVMWTWLALDVAFLFVWMLAVVVDLQRSEVVDIPRLMHLPVTLGWAFAINYLASLMSLTIALFAPAMLGLALGLALDRGPAMLLLVPLSTGLLFMVTAWTYLLQGWIATWVASPRRRRVLVSAIGISAALVGQVPNLIIQLVLRPSEQVDAAQVFAVPGLACGSHTCRPDQACARQCCGASPPESVHRSRRYAPGLMLTAADDDEACSESECAVPGQAEPLKLPPPACIDVRAMILQMKQAQAAQDRRDRFVVKLLLAEEIVPPLWLAGGAGRLAEGDPRVALFGAFGFWALGVLGLLRGYGSTLRFYAKGDGAAGAAPAPSRDQGASARGKRRLVERRIPGVHEQTAAVAVASLQSMLRAPEIMMGLGFLFVMILVMLFMLGTILRHSVEPGSHLAPLVVTGAMAMCNLTSAQLLSNQFGHDRDAFRAFVLAPVARRRLLLGKNLAVLVMSAPPCAVMLAATALWLRLPPLAAVAAVLQMATMLLIAAMVGNLMSILLPYRIQPGSMKATSLPPGAMLGVIGLMFGLPVLYAPAFAGPLAVLLGHHAHWRHPVLVDFTLSLAVAAAAVGAYRASLGPLGRLLQRRETMITARVTVEHD